MRERAHLLALALIAALAGALRFYGLGIHPFWNDEFNTWGVASQGSVLGVVNETSGVHPWGYFLVVHAFQALFGDAEWAVRLPSAVAGFLAVPAIYALGSRLYSHREGLIAALILAVSHQPFYQSQEARMYSVLVLLVIVCTYLWVPILRALRAGESPPLGSSFGHVLVAAACAYTHNFGILFVFLQGCYTIFCARGLRSLGWAVAGYGLVVLLYLPAIPRLLERASRGQANLEFTQRPDLADLAGFAEFLFELELPMAHGLASRPRGLGVAFLVVIGALFAFLAALTVYRLVRGASSLSPTEPTVLLWAWFLGPVAGVGVLSWLWVPLWQDRYLVIVLPAAYLLLARALLQLHARPRVGYACAGILSAVLLGSLFFPVSYYSGAVTREYTREPVRYVAANERGEDYLSYCFGVRPEYMDYYLERSGSDRNFQSRTCTYGEARKLHRAAQREKYDYIYYVDLMPPSFNGGALYYLARNLELVRTETFEGENYVYLFKVPG